MTSSTLTGLRRLAVATCIVLFSTAGATGLPSEAGAQGKPSWAGKKSDGGSRKDQAQDHARERGKGEKRGLYTDDEAGGKKGKVKKDKKAREKSGKKDR